MKEGWLIQLMVWGQGGSHWGQKLLNSISQYIKISSERFKSKNETAKEEAIGEYLNKSDWGRPVFDTKSRR